MYLHWTPGSTLDLLRQVALELDLEPAHYRGDLTRQISQAIVRLNQSKKQHPILICDEAQLPRHPALEQLPLLLNFDMDSSRYLTLLLVGQPLLRRTLSLQMHEALRQRIAVQYHLEGLSREELDAYLAHQLQAAGVTQPLFDDTARQALYSRRPDLPAAGLDGWLRVLLPQTVQFLLKETIGRETCRQTVQQRDGRAGLLLAQVIDTQQNFGERAEVASLVHHLFKVGLGTPLVAFDAIETHEPADEKRQTAHQVFRESDS
jgi:hypothetical protein